MVSFPNEILSIIFRLVTDDSDSLAPTFSDPFVLATYRFSEYTRSYEPFAAKVSISRVCKRWNVLAIPFLSEYLYCTSVNGPNDNRSRRRMLDGLARFLERTGGGVYTKRIDLDIGNFEYEWRDMKVAKRSRDPLPFTETEYHREEWNDKDETYYPGATLNEMHEGEVTNEQAEEEEEDIDDEGEARDEAVEVLYGWQRVLNLVPNLVICTLPNSPPNLKTHDWGQQIIFSLSQKLKPNLRRVDWFGHSGDISHLDLLSVLCPQLQHVCFTMNESRDAETSTDAFSINFPNLEALLVQFNRSPFKNEEMMPPFQPWKLPNLEHLTYFLDAWMGLVLLRPVLESIGPHLRSVEMPIISRNERISFLEELLTLSPNLETLIIDLFKTQFQFDAGVWGYTTNADLPHRHESLKVLGWRLRQTGWDYGDVICTHACKHYFSLERFPSLEKVRIVHPHDFSEYSRTESHSVPFWNELVKGWVPIVDFDGEPITLEDGEDAENDDVRELEPENSLQ
jgi:hypothetical protein